MALSLTKIKKALCAFTQKIRNQPNTLIDAVTPFINPGPLYTPCKYPASRRDKCV